MCFLLKVSIFITLFLCFLVFVDPHKSREARKDSELEGMKNQVQLLNGEVQKKFEDVLAIRKEKVAMGGWDVVGLVVLVAGMLLVLWFWWLECCWSCGFGGWNVVGLVVLVAGMLLVLWFWWLECCWSCGFGGWNVVGLVVLVAGMLLVLWFWWLGCCWSCGFGGWDVVGLVVFVAGMLLVLVVGMLLVVVMVVLNHNIGHNNNLKL